MNLLPKIKAAVVARFLSYTGTDLSRFLAGYETTDRPFGPDSPFVRELWLTPRLERAGILRKRRLGKLNYSSPCGKSPSSGMHL